MGSSFRNVLERTIPGDFCGDFVSACTTFLVVVDTTCLRFTPIFSFDFDISVCFLEAVGVAGLRVAALFTGLRGVSFLTTGSLLADLEDALLRKFDGAEIGRGCVRLCGCCFGLDGLLCLGGALFAALAAVGIVRVLIRRVAEGLGGTCGARAASNKLRRKEGLVWLWEVAGLEFRDDSDELVTVLELIMRGSRLGISVLVFFTRDSDIFARDLICARSSGSMRNQRWHFPNL